ncbi:hypothetical protein M0804_013229 [Polistes exclamans]|nr:hypothetical protein M0804_013229 [Polistes exclamans]
MDKEKTDVELAADKEKMDLEFAVDFLNKFDGKKLDILRWLNCFDFLVDIMAKKDEKEKFLLNMLESSILKQIQEKLSPTNPFDLPYDVLSTVLEEMYGSCQGTAAANYRFYTRVQLPKEPIEHYVLALRKLFSKCAPIIKQAADLKDRFIQGLENEAVKAYLIEHSKDISFGIAYVTNKKIHKDLRFSTVKEEIAYYSKRYNILLANYPNLLANNLLENSY